MMRYQPISPSLFVNNRNNFQKHLQNNALAIFNANDEMPRSADQNFTFKQNSDLFYLTGIDQEHTILLLYPNCPNPLYKEVLFLRQTSDLLQVWEGQKLSKEQAKAISGIETVLWIEDFEAVLRSVVYYAEAIYLNTNEHDSYTNTVPYRDLRLIKEIRSKYPLHSLKRAAPILRALRAVKSEIEIALVQKACAITHDAFIRVLKFMKPGLIEYEIEAEIIHELIKQGATGHAYPPIVASGKNANILHYTNNNQRCEKGDLVLMDFGAEYANYNADLTRTVPVNGRFSKRQREVYDAVLLVLNASTKLMVPGTSWTSYNLQIGEIMTEQLVNLKLISMADVNNQNPAYPAYRKYFMHGISHHLGLDVHDFSGRYTPFAVGNVLTCEPGIYIPQEGFGIRLENDIFIGANGPIDLMAATPIEAEEIEAIMNP